MNSKEMKKHENISNKTAFKKFIKVKTASPCIAQGCFFHKNHKKNNRSNVKKKYTIFVKSLHSIKRSTVTLYEEYVNLFRTNDNFFGPRKCCIINEIHQCNIISCSFDY
ncbi:hypothetical protein NBO_92g0002 [Nosema bombycis CQ1]|uniref:Uncharacterized protein n=1 Tax=Nosema bombycis (strain CQ1 / CVCC 102059) TaxID=578461 RepID=R0M5G9_NOSB1|nr:hypothetical protein NBO_92g0002 [Nosema bombycis CQ1]|eukprot:EOB13249.1 hypothetical protein NBO_92g0002 [Nosema bombycis CQ1]